MKVTEENIIEAINQQYRHQPEIKGLTLDFMYGRMAQVKEVLEFAERYPGFESSEVLFVAYLATQRQINEDSN